MGAIKDPAHLSAPSCLAAVYRCDPGMPRAAFQMCPDVLVRQAVVIYALPRAQGFGNNPCPYLWQGRSQVPRLHQGSCAEGHWCPGKPLAILNPRPHAVTPSLLVGAAQGAESRAFWVGKPTGTFRPTGIPQEGWAGSWHQPSPLWERTREDGSFHKYHGASAMMPLLEVFMHLFPSQETPNPECAQC